MFDLQRKSAVAASQRFQHLQAGRDDLGSDPVARDGCDLVASHQDLPMSARKTSYLARATRR
jgi:hypothetical protein